MIEIRHSMPGRERLRIRGLYRNAALGARLEEVIRGAEGIRMVRVRSICASLVIRYDRRRLNREALYALIAPLAGPVVQPAHSAYVLGITPVDCADCRQAMHPEKKESWLGRIGTFVLLTGYLGYVLVREYVVKRPVPQISSVPAVVEQRSETIGLGARRY